MVRIALELLHPHFGNANRMDDDVYRKLRSHLERWGEYPPVIVRPHPEIAGEYQILDGHHRAKILRELQHTHADCEVWNASDERATLLLLTLNRLHGEDDPQRRGALFEELSLRIPVEELAQLVPEDVGRIMQLMSLNAEPPALAEPLPIEALPEPVTFFMSRRERSAVLQRLQTVCEDRTRALLQLLEVNE